MDDGIDIYEDLPNFNTNDIENCPTNTIEIAGKCEELTKQVNELTEKVKKLEKDNEVLEVNISSLLKTAKAEIARKDRMIADLREQLDNALFRRTGNRAPCPQPRIKKEAKSQPMKEQHFVKKSHYKENYVHTTENEVTSTDIDYSTAIEEEYSEKKAVEAQKKLQETLYGKRLRKRIMEKENEEAKEANKKYKEFVGSSVVESNKENAVVNKIDTDTDTSVYPVENCVVETKKENDSNQVGLSVSEVSNKGSMTLHSTEIPGKRLNEDANNLPSSKRKKNNEDHSDIQYGSQLVASQSCSSTNVTSKSNFEGKHIYHEGKSHDKYGRKKYERRYSEEEVFLSHESKSKHVPEGSSIEPHYDNYERKHYSKRDIDDKRDSYRHRSTDHRRTSRSRERSRERSKEKNNYNRGSDRKYSHKSYDRHYSNDRRTFKSNSRQQDAFKENDLSDSKTFRRNGYDLRDKVENRYEKKSDYIYYESSKYKRNNRYGTETSTRNRRSLSEKKEEVESSSRLCKNTAESIKQEIKEVRESESQMQDNITSNVKIETENVDGLEEGEVMDTPKSTPVKKDVNSIENSPPVINTEEKHPVEKTVSEIHQITNTSDNKADTSVREEDIENIQQFIENYDDEKFSSKQPNTDTWKYDNDKIENVENVLAMDDDLNQNEEVKDTNKKCKENIVDGNGTSPQNNHVHVSASIKSQESVQMTEEVVLDKHSDVFLTNVDDTICKLPCKLEETIKADAIDKNLGNSETEQTFASSNVTIPKAECTDDKSSTNQVRTENRNIETHSKKETSETNRHVDDDVSDIKTEKDDLKEPPLCNKEISLEEKILIEPKKEVAGLSDKPVPLESTKVSPSIDVSKVTEVDDVCVTDKDNVNSHRTSLPVEKSAEETKADSCRDNKQIKGCPSNLSKANESKSGNNDRGKVIVARRRKPVQLGDMNASMTIVMSQSAVKPSDNVNKVSENSNTLKPRACKVPRSYKKIN